MRLRRVRQFPKQPSIRGNTAGDDGQHADPAEMRERLDLEQQAPGKSQEHEFDSGQAWHVARLSEPSRARCNRNQHEGSISPGNGVDGPMSSAHRRSKIQTLS